MHLPAGSQVLVERVGDRFSASVQEDRDAPEWSFRVQAMQSTLRSPTAADQIVDHLRRMEATGRPHRILSNESVVYRGRPGQLCYVEESTADGQQYATGWLIMPLGPGRFLVCSVLTLPEHLPRVRPLLDASFSTIGLRSEERLAAERMAKLEAGRVYLASLTEERLRSLLGTTRWFRVYRPDATGQEQELGYSRLEIQEGKKGRLNSDRGEHEYHATEHEQGLLVVVQGRIVVDAAAGQYYDSIGLYWMAWDQSTEAWSVRATHRQGDSEKTDTETGLRAASSAGEPAQRLTVIRSTSSRREPQEWTVPEFYMSQGLTWIAPWLPPSMPEDEPVELAFYFVHGRGVSPTLSLREDVWTRAEATGELTLRSRLTSETNPTVSVFDARGELRHRRQPDGTVTEAIAPEALQSLYMRKGLTMGGQSR
jgi:hypothetical protein